MKHTIIYIILVLCILMAFNGCSKQPEQMDFLKEPTTQPTVQEWKEDDGTQGEQTNTNWSNPANGEELFDVSDLQGSVVELLDGGCLLSPTFTDGNVAAEAAQGYEDQQECTTVIFNDDCIFQIVYVSIQTGSVSYENANENDVKKQTRLMICGEYDNDGILRADRVFIYRSMG